MFITVSCQSYAPLQIKYCQQFQYEIKQPVSSWKTRLTRKFEFPAAGVAVVFCPEVSDGIVSEVGRSEYHVVRSAAETEG